MGYEKVASILGAGERADWLENTRKLPHFHRKDRRFKYRSAKGSYKVHNRMTAIQIWYYWVIDFDYVEI